MYQDSELSQGGETPCFVATIGFKSDESDKHKKRLRQEFEHQEASPNHIDTMYQVVLQGKTFEDHAIDPAADGVWSDQMNWQSWKKRGEAFPGLEQRKVDMRKFNGPAVVGAKDGGLVARRWRLIKFYRLLREDDVEDKTKNKTLEDDEDENDLNLHACAHLYASDRNSLFLGQRALGFETIVAQGGSLAHTVIFHGPPSRSRMIDDTTGKRKMCVQESWTSNSGADRLCHNSRLWDYDKGRIIATTLQDGMHPSYHLCGRRAFRNERRCRRLCGTYRNDPHCGHAFALAYVLSLDLLLIAGLRLNHMFATEQENRPPLHHMLEPGMDQSIYVNMSEPICRSCAVLMDDKTMAAEIDRVIVDCVRSKLPGYIYVPMDVVSVPVDADRLKTRLDVTIRNDDDSAETSIVGKVLDAIKTSPNTAVLVDTLAARHDARDLARELVEVTHFPNFSTHLSRGVLDESSPYWNGVYNGAGKCPNSTNSYLAITESLSLVSFPGVKEGIESSDLVINIGPLLSDSNTGGFTREIPDEKLVILAHDHCQVRIEKFPGFHFRPILSRLLHELRKHPKDYGLPRDQSSKRIEVSQSSFLLINCESWMGLTGTDTAFQQCHVWSYPPVLLMATNRSISKTS